MKCVHVVSAALSLMVAVGAAYGQTISKCQDADGNWHYGDFASEVCAESSTITEMDQSGTKVDESDAPPTAEELETRRAAEAQEREEEQRRARRQANDRRLLQTYDSAQSIVTARDQRVNALERELESHRLFRQDLVDEKETLQNGGNNGERIDSLNQQIAQYDAAIRALVEERESTVQEYNQELERYRELTDE